jgi:hypothetical protein
MRSLTLLSALVTSLVVAVPAFAQEEGDGSETPAPKPKPAPKPVAAAPAAAEPAAAADTKTDHEAVVGRMGVGYLGNVATPLGANAGALTAHIVGIRYWVQNGLAIVGGLGFGSSSSSRSQAGNTQDGPAATTFGLKGGVAIALASGKHFTFVIEPQAIFGYSTQKITEPGRTIDHSGNRFLLGSTIGGEVQFGFIGIPELSLVGAVGVAFDTQSGKTVETAGTVTETAFAKTDISTFTMANPWNIFTGSIAAIYYL